MRVASAVREGLGARSGHVSAIARVGVLVLGLLVAMAVIPGSVVLAADASTTQTRRTVRVAVSDSDFSTIGEANSTASFETDYLQAVAEYANWNLTFVPGSWVQCLDMLRTGEADVLYDVTKTAEREEYLDFSSEPMGTETVYLVGRSDTTMSFDDFQAFNGMRVGYVEESANIDALAAYASQRGFSYSLTGYSSTRACYDALAAGEVDVLVQSSYVEVPSGCLILSKFSPGPVFIATTKTNPALKTELDAAMAQLFNYDPGFNTTIFNYHFGRAVLQATGFTQAEQSYIASKPVVTVYFESSWEPIEYLRDGQAAGITPEIIRAIGNDTGIDFRFVSLADTQEVFDASDATDVVVTLSYDFNWASDHDFLVTQPFATTSVMRVSGGSSSKTVAVVSGLYLTSQVAAMYPELETVECDTTAQCMDAVLSGAADCTFLNFYQANYYRSTGAYDTLLYQPDGSLNQSLSLGVSKEANPALFGVISKSLQRLSAGTVQGIVNENSTLEESPSLVLLIRRYPIQMALAVAAVGVALGLIIFLAVTSGARKRKNEELQLANSAKSEFLSRMSHDIRTPLNGIIGMTRMAREQDNPPETDACLDKVDISSRFLLGLVNDVLDMSKAESGRMELRPEPYLMSDFDSYLDSVIRPLCAEKNQTLEIVTKPVASVVPIIDILRFNQIMFNLLSNAVKYTPEGGHISFIDINELEEGHRERITITVADDGIGMSEEFQKVLFEPFSQENRRETSESTGSGLGLSIVKKIVDIMGGTIQVSSELGRGSTFTVVLHFDYLEADQATWVAPSAASVGKTESLKGLHVLLCEDHPLNREIAVHLLDQRGMLVTCAEDGQLGVEAFSASPEGFYDLILMDVRMPVMGGLDATRAIRALDRLDATTVPIIAMTADAYAEDVQNCIDAGMNAHVAKPVDPDVFFDTIVRVLGTKG